MNAKDNIIYEPLQHKILIKKDESKVEGGIIIPDSAEKPGQLYTVVAISPDIPEGKCSLAVNDLVVTVGNIVYECPDKIHYLINYMDIVARVKPKIVVVAN